jgi:hypothetical protein
VGKIRRATSGGDKAVQPRSNRGLLLDDATLLCHALHIRDDMLRGGYVAHQRLAKPLVNQCANLPRVLHHGDMITRPASDGRLDDALSELFQRRTPETADRGKLMRVLVMGLNHQIQRPFGSNDRRAVDFVLDQKHRFAEVIREAIRSHGVEFVGEEANHKEPSIAESVCNEEGCRYANMEMPPEERTRRGIPPGYNENDKIAADEKASWNREREDYMVKRVLSEAGHSESALIICGSQHSEPLAQQLRAKAHAVELDDLQKQSWYVEDWWHHIMHNL